jgi:hypothetical protein
VETNLVGEYVTIPDEGDAGWVRAVFVSGGDVQLLVQRDNISRDLRSYFAELVVIPEVKK